MNIERTILAAAIAAGVWGCAGPKQEIVKPAPAARAQSIQDSLNQMEKLSAELKAVPALAAPALPAFPSALAALGGPLEPALCARAAGAPVYDAAHLNCIVGWMRAAQDYLAQGGAPTKYTNQREFDSEKKEALDMLAAQAKWLSDAKWEAKANPAVVAAADMNSHQASQQRYLDGVLAFQKGDSIQARASWTDSLKLDPANADAQAGLELLDKRHQ